MNSSAPLHQTVAACTMWNCPSHGPDIFAIQKGSF